MQKRASSMPYRPEIDWNASAAFDARLSSLGDWWTTGRSYHHDGTNDLVRLQWIIPGDPWANETGFLRFLDDPLHRQIIRWFLQNASLAEEETQEMYEQREGWPFWEVRLRRIWATEELLQKMGAANDPSYRNRLEEVLRFLVEQDYVLEWGHERWTGGPALEKVHDLGSTLEWLTQAHLRNQYGALTRRRVHFSQWEKLKLNDLDLIAFTEELVIIAECKSGINIQPDEVLHFVQRAQHFPADLALFLIDTPAINSVRKYARKMQRLLGEPQPAALERLKPEEGNLIICIAPNIFVANTATSIQGVLDHVMEWGLLRKQEGCASLDISS
jgi:hypothetical protein